MEQQLYTKNYKAYVSLVSVIILGAVATLVVTTILLTGTDSFLQTSAQQNSLEARTLADSCAEIALNELKKDNNYAGNVTLTIGNGNCQISAIAGSGNTNRTIQATGNVRGVVRKVKVVVTQLNPTTNISSWQEVALF